MARLINAFEQFFDPAGDPLISGKLYFYESGSSTVLKNTYADVNETIANSNPVILNGDGRCPNVFGSGSYRVILTDSDDVQILSRDPVGGGSGQTFGADWNNDAFYDVADIVRDNDLYWESQVVDNQGNNPSSDPGTNWTPWPPNVGDAEVFALQAEAARDAAAISETNAAASASAASTSETNAAASETNAAASAAAAASDAADTAADAVATAADRVQTGLDVTAAAASAQTAEDWAESPTEPGGPGSKSAKTWAGEAAASVGATQQIASASRNQVLNQDPLSQGEASRNGVGILSYLGNGTSQTIPTGVDMFSADFGGLIWIKDRDALNSHFLQDSVRSNFDAFLSSDTTAAEALAGGTGIASVTASGFNVGSSTGYNTSGRDYAAWCFQTTKIATGLTNRNKAYTCHFNPDMGFSIVGYVGDGVAGHEIPHHLGRAPDLSIFKNRDIVTDWPVVFGDYSERLDLNLTGASAAISGILSTNTSISLNTFNSINSPSDAMVSYHFANTPGLIKVGKYIGTGAAGNYVSTESEPGKGDGFKPAWIVGKRLSQAGSWFIVDTARGVANELYADLNFAESVVTSILTAEDGFIVNTTGTGYNALNDEYLFLAIAETGTAGNRVFAQYDYATAANEVTINQDTLISFAEGFNSNGEVNTQEQVGASTTFTVPVSNENKKLYLYKDKAGAYGVTEYRPLEEQDYFGVQSPLGGDVNLRTTARHFDYESSTGVASASEETGSQVAWGAFSARPNDILPSTYWAASTPTTSWLQYKFSEPRVLKSWRLREVNDTTESPRRFTIEGSNDGLNWTAIDSSYTSADYSGNGTNLWGDLQDTSANTTAYLCHRINITANNGDATYTSINQLELNTITPSDRYDVVDGKMYDSAGSPISRVYLGEFRTDGDGDIVAETLVNYTPAKRKVIDEEVHGDLIVRGEIENPQVATAWVNFDGAQNPPLIRSSYNVSDIVDLGAGFYRVVYETPMDNDAATPTGAAIETTTFGIANTVRSRNYVDVKVKSTSTGSDVDSNIVTVNVFGGKD